MMAASLQGMEFDSRLAAIAVGCPRIRTQSSASPGSSRFIHLLRSLGKAIPPMSFRVSAIRSSMCSTRRPSTRQ